MKIIIKKSFWHKDMQQSYKNQQNKQNKTLGTKTCNNLSLN